MEDGIVIFLIVVAIVVFTFIGGIVGNDIGYNGGYRQGQIDYVRGEVTVEGYILVNGDTTWVIVNPAE